MIKSTLKSIGYLVSYFLINMIILSCSSIFLKAKMHGTKSKTAILELVSGNGMLLVVILTNIVAICIFAWIIKIRSKKESTNILHKTASKKKIGLSLLSAFVGSMMIWTVMSFVNFKNSVSLTKSVDYFSGLMPGLGNVMLFVTMILLQPVIEEMLCRRLVLTEIRKVSSEAVAILVSSLLFGLMHGMAGGVPLVLAAAVMGAILGIIYVKSGSLALAIGGHMVANLADYIMPYVESMSSAIRGVIVVIFAAICFISVRRLCKDEK